MKKNKKKYKFYTSLPLMLGILFIIALAFALFLFITIYEPMRVQLLDNLVLLFFMILFLVILPILIFILTAPRFLKLLVIDKDGIKSSLFHYFKRKEIHWEEVKEVSYYSRIYPFLMVSMSGTIEGMEYEEIIKRKDILQLSLSKKVLEAFNAYCPIEIKGLPKELIDGANNKETKN